MLKKLSTTILLTLLLIGTNLAQRPLNKFIDNHKNQDKAVCMTLPGWLLRSGFNFAENFAEEQDEKAFLDLGQYFKKLRFLVIDEKAHVSDYAIQTLLNDLPDHGMEKFVSFREEGNNVNVWVREKDDIVKNLSILIRGEDNLIVVNLNTDMPLDALKEANFSFNSKRKESTNHH